MSRADTGRFILFEMFTRRNMKKLIVNADDFGSHELVNFAVNDAFNNGICKSASIMAGGNAFNDAVKIVYSA